jgi:alpha-tubulin suppressor-like RCC1 family protein
MAKTKLTAVALGVAVVMAGCTGDDSTVSQVGGVYEVSSGLAQKGPLLRGSSVTINELNTSTLQPNGKSYTFEVLDDSGTFKPSNITFSSAILESTALGYYFNELTGATSDDMVYVRGLSNLASGYDKAVNLNILTSFIKERVKKLVTTTPRQSFTTARPQAERELLGAFYIYNAADLMPGTTVSGVLQPKNFMELDLSKKRAGDQILAAMSGMLIQAGQTGSGVNSLVNQIETDLADDGLINNSPSFAVSVQQQLWNAAKNTDFAAVAANLNAFYKTSYTAQDLSQWVDTSGGVDKVIDKYKFTNNDVAAGVEARSPDYIAGSDDIGQCLYVDNGVLYINGTKKLSIGLAAKGDRISIGLNGSSSGNPRTAFLGRVPKLNGTCPTSPPLSGEKRLFKFSISHIPNTSAIQSIAAGWMHALATKKDGSLWAWGGNWNGQLGDGTTVDSYTPKLIGSGYTIVSAGTAHSGGIKQDATLWLWGQNTNGQVNETKVSPIRTPIQVSSNFKSLNLGVYSTSGCKTDRSLWTWGWNPDGVLGNGTYSIEPDGGAYPPAKIESDCDVITFSNTGFLIKTDGSNWAWGQNRSYQIGNLLSERILSPTKQTSSFTAISAKQFHTLAIKPNGDLYAWGSNSNGQLGDGTTTDSWAPKLITSNVAAFALGWQHSVAIKTDGSLWTWGANNNGQLGDGSSTEQHHPKKIGDGYVAVVAGDKTTYGIKNDGSLWSWGENQRGGIGDGTAGINRLTPTRIFDF